MQEGRQTIHHLQAHLHSLIADLQHDKQETKSMEEHFQVSCGCKLILQNTPPTVCHTSSDQGLYGVCAVVCVAFLIPVYINLGGGQRIIPFILLRSCYCMLP